MGIFQKPEITGNEAVAVLFHCIWAITYDIAKWTKNSLHKSIHVIWAVGFVILFNITMLPIFAWLTVVPPVLYTIVWALWLRKKFDKHI